MSENSGVHRRGERLVGVALALIGAFALWNTQHLRILAGAEIGAGALPRLTALLLLCAGLALAWRARGALSQRTPVPVRGMVVLVAASVFFAASLHTLGFVLAVFGAAIIAGWATRESLLAGRIVCAAVIAAFASFLFFYLLKIPAPLWPW